ncbi:MAG: hypothetical protein ACXVS6_22665 [Solirubrobacteraceae bacterium]
MSPKRRDQPRLLHRRSQRGYTSDPAYALFAEPEAVSRSDQERITLAAHRAAHAAQVAEWEQRRHNVEREIGWLYSQRFQRDVSAQLRQLEKQLQRIDAKIAG